MKNLKSLLSIFALVFAVSFNANAQTSDNATVAANATIVESITVSFVSDLEFGDILTSATPTIIANSDDAGVVSVTGATASQVLNVTATFPSVLTDGTPANDLSLASYDVAVRTDGTNAGSGASDLTDETTTDQDVTGTFTATANTAYIYVGAQIDDATNGVAGNNYTNNITITVSY